VSGGKSVQLSDLVIRSYQIKITRSNHQSRDLLNSELGAYGSGGTEQPLAVRRSSNESHCFAL
jgi:hypothetical protein